MLAAIQHTVNNSHIPGFELVINRVGKALGEQPVKTGELAMNSGIKRQRVNVRKKRVEEITAESLTLTFIKITEGGR
jgi:hypothetical protein